MIAGKLIGNPENHRTVTLDKRLEGGCVPPAAREIRSVSADITPDRLVPTRGSSPCQVV